MTNPIAVGVDLGGTHVRFGAFNADGELLARRVASSSSVGPQQGLQLIEEETRLLLCVTGAHSLVGIGIASTGPLDRKRGMINNPYTLSGWIGVPIVEHLGRSFKVPVSLENDADAAALGEFWKGAGRGAQRLYAVTVGTGVGTALLVQGEIYRGLDGSHPEGGHQLIDPAGPECYCGNRGCWESLIAGPAIARQARAALGNQHLLDLASGDAEAIDARLVATAASSGDPTAWEVMNKVAHNLALGIINVIALFVPDVIVLGGGIMENAGMLLPVVEAALHACEPVVPFQDVRLQLAQLGDNAGLYGAAYSAFLEK